MSREGTVVDGQVVFAEPLPFPDGTRVEVKPIAPTSLGERLQWLEGAIPDLPADFAAEHDHYIHGAPRRGVEEKQ